MKVMAVLSVSLSKNIDKRMEKEYTLIDKVFFDLTVMSTDQEEKKEAIKISGVVMSVKILGTGSFLPEKSVSNDDLSKVMDTNDEWISSRTGIRSRHISIEDTTSTMAVKAAEKALEDAGISAEELEESCRKCVRIEVTNVKALVRVLDEMKTDYNIISDNVADIFAKINISKLTLALSKENCEVISMQERDESLESYYVGLVGGKDNE